MLTKVGVQMFSVEEIMQSSLGDYFNRLQTFSSFILVGVYIPTSCLC